jgi:hypothetical protein
MFYRDEIVVGIVVLMVIVIALVLVIPMCFRLCWNKCRYSTEMKRQEMKKFGNAHSDHNYNKSFNNCHRCCRVSCKKCNKRRHKKLEEEWVGTKNNPLTRTQTYGTADKDEYGDKGKYSRVFSPVLPVQVFVFLCIGFIFVGVSLFLPTCPTTHIHTFFFAFSAVARINLMQFDGNNICALTDVPFYAIWIIMFFVWTVLYIDYLKRKYKNNEIKREKEKEIAMVSRRREEEKKEEEKKEEEKKRRREE